MSEYPRAIELIKKHEGFSGIAIADPETGAEPFTLGYGTTHYPGGHPVRQGHRVTEQMAHYYLEEELKVIAGELAKEELTIDSPMEEALLSFIFSVGWTSFLYAPIIDQCEREEWLLVGEEMQRWIFDSHHNVIGDLVERRREEAKLFLETSSEAAWFCNGEVLLKAFRNYRGSAQEVEAIRGLEEKINPYALAAFANAIEEIPKDANDFDLSWAELHEAFDR